MESLYTNVTLIAYLRLSGASFCTIRSFVSFARFAPEAMDGPPAPNRQPDGKYGLAPSFNEGSLGFCHGSDYPWRW